MTAGDLPADAEVTRKLVVALSQATSTGEQMAAVVQAVLDLENRYLKVSTVSNSTLRRVAEVQRTLGL